MIAYKEIAQIKNVKGVNPITGDYSYEENGRGYLYIDGVLLEKEEAASKIVSVGEYTYVRYNRYGTLEVYSGHTLLKVFERDIRLLDGDVGAYVGIVFTLPKLWMRVRISFRSQTRNLFCSTTFLIGCIKWVRRSSVIRSSSISSVV